MLKIKGDRVKEGKKDEKEEGEVVERNGAGEVVGKERGKGEEGGKGVAEGRKARAGWVVDRWRECDWIVAASSRSRSTGEGVGEKEGRGLDEVGKGRLVGNKAGEGGRKTES